MREDRALDELRRLIGEAVKTDAASLTDDSSPETIATWDSAAGISLMILLAKRRARERVEYHVASG
jgi:hypothetical protein